MRAGGTAQIISNESGPSTEGPQPLMTVLHPIFDEERELVRLLRAGDERAFESFAEHYAPALYRFASARLPGQQELVREVVQITLCKFIETLESYRGDATLFTWLCTFCRNEIAGHFRKAKRAGGEVELNEDTDVRERQPSDDPELQLLAREEGRLVHVTLDDMPPRYAAILEWKYVDGLPVREIARRLSLSEKASESLLTRARSAFRVTYERLRRIAAGGGQ